MGDLALAATRGAANAAGIITGEQPEAKAFVYYDILGQFGLTYSLFTSQILNSLVLLALPTYLAYSAFQSHHSNTNTNANKACGPAIKRTVIGVVIVTITFVTVLAFSLLVGFLLTKTNPLVSKFTVMLFGLRDMLCNICRNLRLFMVISNSVLSLSSLPPLLP
jgi:hypothetical protein